MSLEWGIDELEKATQGKLLSRVGEKFDGVSIDTREDLNGKIFVAIKGGRLDGHNFLEKAVEGGAKVLVVHSASAEVAALKDKATIIHVMDTTQALQDMASYWRTKLKAKVVAITGSNGKTTTKDFIRAILEKDFRVKASKQSFNNHWGVPLTLLGVDPDDQVAIVEMGMNHAGEIANLCKIAKPDVAVVTMIGQSHIGFLGSQESVVAAKEEIYNSSPKAIHIINMDNQFTREMFFHRKNNSGEVITFSTHQSSADISIRIVEVGVDYVKVTGQIKGVQGEARVPVFGRHNAVNLMASSAIAVAVGLAPEKIWEGMPRCQTSWGRNKIYEIEGIGAKVLFDAYNANPESMIMTIKNVFEMNIKGRKIMVLGEMLELGDISKNVHRDLGEMVSNTDANLVWFIGSHKNDFKEGFCAFGSGEKLIVSDTFDEKISKKIESLLSKDDFVVVKGSRGLELEKLLKVWSIRT